MCKKKCCKHRTKINKTIQSQSRLDLIIGNPFDDSQKDFVLMNDIPIPKGLKNSKQFSKEDDSLLRPIIWIDIHKGPSSSKLFATDVVTLCDSGADDTMIKRRCLPDGTTLIKSPEEYEIAGGIYKTKYKAVVHFTLPEFSSSKRIFWKCVVDDDEGNGIGYDMIMGRDLMAAIGLHLDFRQQTICWDKMDTSMKSPSDLAKVKTAFTKKEIKTVILQNAEPSITQEATERAIKILDSEYDKANLDEIVSQADSLTKQEKQQLLKLLQKYEILFDGTLGKWGGEPVRIKLKPDAKPFSSRFYPIPHINKETFRKELERLVRLGVLTKVKQSEWGTPVFIIPKKNGQVRFLTDFRKLNPMIVRETFPLPRIIDEVQQMESFNYASALDLNMGYYTIQVHPESKDCLTIVTEFGKFRYNSLPMGLVTSADIFQAKVNELLGDIERVKCYIDDILVLSSGSFDRHLEKLELCFQRFKSAGLKLNGPKCHFGLKEISYLGYIITLDGVKPDPAKIKAIMTIDKPKTVTELRAFIGMVQYYRDMYKRRSHILAPLTEKCQGKKRQPIVWTEEMNIAFVDTKKMIATETLLTYPDWTKPFDIHTDASDKQLGAVISQEGKPLAFYSRTLSSAQKNYTTTEKELLSIVECLKQFRGVLFGYEINVYSDHKNLIYATTMSESQRVMRWRLILEEFGPNIKHISGSDNIIADALSRLPTTSGETHEHSTDGSYHLAKGIFAASKGNKYPVDDIGFPLALSIVQREQQKELANSKTILAKALQDKKSGYHTRNIEDVDVICYAGKIYVPEALRGRTLEWYHHFLEHPGGSRLGNTIGTIAYWHGLKYQAKQVSKLCITCQSFKKRRTKYGQVPAKVVTDVTPWNTVHIDLIGPYTKAIKQEQSDGSVKLTKVQLTLMTFLDPNTGWFEMAEVPTYEKKEIDKMSKIQIDKTSARISLLFKKTWLDRYPRPKQVVFDNGSEFKRNFVPLLKDFDVKPKVTTIKNPQGNSPVERIHQVIGNMLLTKKLSTRIFDHIDPWGDIISSVAWAIRASYHHTLQATPGQLVFGRDMLLNVEYIANWHEMTSRKQKDIEKSNSRENQKRIDFDYKVGQKVFVTSNDIKCKLDNPKEGPYLITDCYTNGTLRIQKGHVNERINIRRCEPCFE